MVNYLKPTYVIFERDSIPMVWWLSAQFTLTIYLHLWFMDCWKLITSFQSYEVKHVYRDTHKEKLANSHVNNLTNQKLFKWKHLFQFTSSNHKYSFLSIIVISKSSYSLETKRFRISEQETHSLEETKWLMLNLE